jgi:hypothetical protein
MLDPRAVQLLAKLLADGERIRLSRPRTFTYRRIELAVDIERLEFGVRIREYLRQRYRLVQVTHCHAPATLSHSNHRSHHQRVYRLTALFLGVIACRAAQQSHRWGWFSLFLSFTVMIDIGALAFFLGFFLALTPAFLRILPLVIPPLALVVAVFVYRGEER